MGNRAGAFGRLPDERDPKSPLGSPFDEYLHGARVPAGRRPSVLVADADSDTRNFVRQLLASRWDVEAVSDGQAALDAALRREPDLVLADIAMPRPGGMALLWALRRDPRFSGLPVILLSARGGRNAEIEALSAGADDFLPKPFSARELIMRIRACLARAHLRNEELDAMSRLNRLSTRLTATSDLSSLLQEILDAAIELQQADFGIVQIFDRESQTLEICAQRGYEQDALEHIRNIGLDQGVACTRSARERRRVIIEDVFSDPEFASLLQLAESSGFRAVQSTPLIERGSGALVGVFSTQFRNPHRPSERDLRLTDLYAQQAADLIAFRLSERRLRESETRLKAAVDLVGMGSYDVDVATSTVRWDDRMKAMWGLPADAPVDCSMWRDAVHPDDLSRFDGALAECFDPRLEATNELEYRVIGIADGVERWVATRGSTTFGNGHPVRFSGVAHDITRRKRGEQANLLLIAELQHRTRNLLAVVSAIAADTLAASHSLDEFSATFSDRLAALSRVQGLLSRGEVNRVTIDELVRLELRALGADPDGRRVTVDGPDVALPAKSVQILALALHELATNARKYGALLAPQGRLAVTWHKVEKSGIHGLAIEWREQGAANGTVARADRRGFGRTLIEQALPYQLDAQTKFEFVADGVFCSVTIGLDSGTPGALQ